MDRLGSNVMCRERKKCQQLTIKDLTKRLTQRTKVLLYRTQTNKQTQINKRMKWSKNSLKNGDNMHNRPLSGQRTGKQNTKISLLRLLHFPSLFMFCFCFTLPHFRFPHPLLSLSLLSRNHVIKLVGICNHVCNGRTVYATAEFFLDLNCSIVKIRPPLLRRLLPTNMLYPPTCRCTEKTCETFAPMHAM